MEALVRLLPETLAANKRRTREHRCKKLCEKADCRRYPTHTLAPDPEQAELALQPMEEGRENR